MKKDIRILYQINEGGNINADECIRINRALALTEVDDIPVEQRENVKNYLATALNMNSVEHNLVGDLDKLLELLRQADNI